MPILQTHFYCVCAVTCAQVASTANPLCPSCKAAHCKKSRKKNGHYENGGWKWVVGCEACAALNPSDPCVHAAPIKIGGVNPKCYYTAAYKATPTETATELISSKIDWSKITKSGKIDSVSDYSKWADLSMAKPIKKIKFEKVKEEPPKNPWGWKKLPSGRKVCNNCFHYLGKKHKYCDCECHPRAKKKVNTTKVFLEKIGLHPELNLKMECADFYLLEKMVAEAGFTDNSDIFMGNEKVLAMLKEREEFLAREFGTYLDMVCGGEARYAGAEATGYSGSLSIYSPETQDYINKVASLKRESAWKIYMALRRKAPKKTLKLLEEITAIFEEKWRGGAGGEPWAKIARVVLAYKQGKMGARSFVNLSFSLQHNNDAVFDKVYNIGGLGRVLEVQASGHYDRGFFYGTGEPDYSHRGLWLISWASPEVQVMWKRHVKERHQPQGMDVPSWHGTGD